jgi:FixJ family two-component response regulator
MAFKILYLDDEPDLCEIMYYTLSSDEVEIETFQDDKIFMDKCNITKPDLVILDYRLVGTTGDEVAQKLAPDIPKILITGEINLKCTYNFDKILSKPFREEELMTAIDKIKKGGI